MRLVVLLGLLTACNIPRSDVAIDRRPAGEIARGPYILPGGVGRAHIAWSSEKAGVLEWWPQTAREDVRVVRPVRERDLWIVDVQELPTDGEVEYRVRVGKWSSPIRSFRIGRARGESFRFAAFGDTRTRHSVHAAVIQGLARERVDFVVHTGDMVETGGVAEQWDRFFRIETPLLSHAPVFPSIGNHDMGARDLYDHYWLLARWTGGKRYYHHDWGNLRLIALDGSIESRSGSDQYAYAEVALKEAAEKKLFAVLFLHWPPYSSGSHGSQLYVREPIARLAKRYGVELVIAGHDHNYERTKPIDGTTYIVSGSAGAPTRPVKPQWFTAHARTEPHYVLIDVERDSMTLRAVNLDGTVFDSVVIRDTPPAEAH